MKTKILKTALITLGCVIYSVGIAMFLSPNDLAPGGVTGISVIINRFWGVGIGVLVLLGNIPLIAIGWYKFGFKFIISTIYVIVLSSVLISLLERFAPVPQLDLFIAALAGGAVMGLGMAIVFAGGATTGGTDILIKLIRLKYRHIKTGRIFLITDSVIVAASAIAFKNLSVALYAGFALVVFSFVFDAVLYGTDGARLVFIVTKMSEPIAARALKELDIGATYVRGVGAYSNSETTVLMCAIRKQLFPKLKEIISAEDETAFMIVSSASEIFGEGFKKHGEEK